VAVDVSGDVSANGILGRYIRNATVATLFDISGGNISNSATTRSSNFIGTTTTASNNIGGITLSNNRIGILRPAPGVAVDVSGDVFANGIIGTYIRDGIIPITFDISGGNISNSGNIRVGSGTVSAPTYTFLADASLGLYRAAANQLAITTAGVERMRVNATGNVGIGTRNPTFLLDISGGDARVQAKNVNFLVNDTSSGFIELLTVANDYGVIRANGSIDNFTAGTTSTAAASANPKNRLSADSGASWFTGSLVGINTRVPLVALDISGQFSSILIGRAGTTVDGDGLLIQGASNQGYIRPQAASSILYLGASNLNSVQVGAQSMGIQAAPSALYSLDISAVPGSNASINMNTWPRISTTSNTFLCIGSTTRLGSVMQWNAPTISMSTNLLTFVSNNVTNGAYWVINRSGIWSISVNLTNQDDAQWMSLDVCTNIAFSARLNNVNTLAQSHNRTYGSFGYTGYLSSNATMYYKVMAVAGEQNSLVSKLSITFHREMPNINPVFPRI
jgi:hypothetical protein